MPRIQRLTKYTKVRKTMFTELRVPRRITWDNHNGTVGKEYLLLGFVSHLDKSLSPILVNPDDGRLLTTGLYDIQMDMAHIDALSSSNT